MQVFVTINNVRMKINVGVNVKNWLIKVYDKGFIWNPGNCECDESWDVGEYLDYSNCKCRKRLVDKLIEECTGNIDEIKSTSKDEHENKCSFCTVYIVLFSIFFIISIGIGYLFCLL